MKKEEFFTDLGEIHFLISCFISLFPYIESGVKGDVIDAQLDNIRRFDKNDFWLGINSQNILKKQKSIDTYLRKNGVVWVRKFMSLQLSSRIQTNLHLWFSSMLMLEIFADDCRAFLEFVIDFFLKHIRCFSAVNYLQLVDLLLTENCLDLVSYLSQKVSVPYDLSPDLIMQIFDAKYSSKYVDKFSN